MGVFLKALRPITGPGIFWPQDWNATEPVGRSLTGVSVTSETAFGVPAFTAGVRALSEDIAKLPFITYEAMGRGKRRAPEHPLYRVLHDVANPEMTAFIWREVSVAHMVAWGNCYSEIQRNGLGEIVALWPLPPHRVTVKRDPETRARFYRVRLPNPDPETGNYEKDLPAERVFHVPGLGYDGLVGYNVVEMMAKSLGIALASQEHAERFWENNARPGGVLQVPGDLQMSDVAMGRLREQFTASHGGLSNAQRIALLQDGITFKEVGIPPEAAQFLETRKFQVTEIARGIRIQPHKIMDLERATFSNIEQQNLEYVTDSLGGWAGRIEAQAKKDLFTRPEDKSFFAELLFDALLRGDSLTRARVWATYRMNGNVTANYINERENFPLRTDPGGDTYMLPLNIATEGEEGKTAIEATPDILSEMSYAQRVDAATALIRAGFEPSAALAAVGLPAIDHTGLVPVTVKPEEELAGNGRTPAEVPA